MGNQQLVNVIETVLCGVTGTRVSTRTARAVADEVMATLPDLIAPLVWELYSPDDQPYWNTGGYTIQSRPRGTWEWRGKLYDCPDKAKAACTAHYVAEIMAAFPT
jgi:hypothetical protein